MVVHHDEESAEFPNFLGGFNANNCGHLDWSGLMTSLPNNWLRKEISGFLNWHFFLLRVIFALRVSQKPGSVFHHVP